MKARAKVELTVELENVEGLEAAKAELLELMKKLKKVAVKVKCTALELQADTTALDDMVVE